MRVPVAVLICAAALAGQQEWRTTVPYTYNIDYSQGHVGNPEYLRKIAAGPPTLMHVGEDVVFSSVFGVKDIFGGPQRTHTKVITVEQAREKMRAMRGFTASLHQAGVKWIIPYINNHTILGDHEKRIGFWEFFDHWDRYREFGFGPTKPPADILTARMDGGYPHPVRWKEIHRDDPNYPYRRYGLCTNHPIWLGFLKTVTRNIARGGMDGVFADEMTFRDYCSYDEALFKEYLSAKYSAAERERRFGRADVSTLRLGRPGDGALYYDTLAFWSHSNARFLKTLLEEGRQENPDFFVMANLGPFAHFAGAYSRTAGGKNPEDWAPYTRLIMFEEMQRPGQLAAGVFFDNILQFKLAFGMGFVGGTLLYYAQEPPGIELSTAEAGAGGGGAFVQGGYREPEVRKKYRAFFESHPGWFEGYESRADVAIVFDYAQAWWGNAANLRALYPLAQYLAQHHVLFDVIPLSRTPASLLSSRYKVVITPGLRYLSDQRLEDFQEFARRGGAWLDIAESGRFDDAGRVRVRPKPPREERSGQGRIVRHDSIEELLEVPAFAHYLLSEDEANDLTEIVKLHQATQAPGSSLFRKPPVKPAGEFRDVLERLAGTQLSIVRPGGFEGLRANAWQKSSKTGTRITVHFVNYYSPIPANVVLAGEKFELGGSPEQYAPKTLRGVPVRLRIPEGRAVLVKAIDPDLPGVATVSFRQDRDVVAFDLPPTRVYKIVELTVR